VQLALRSALSDRAAEGRVGVVEAWDFPAPKTKDAKRALSTLGLTGKILVVLDRDQDTAERSFRNLREVHTILASELNAYDVLCCDWIVFTQANVPTAQAGPDTEPTYTEPAAAEPAGTEPTGTEPAGTEPAAAEPTAFEEPAAEPAGTEGDES